MTMISTRGRYALRVLIDLAENGKQGCIPLKSIAERQDISKKYVEKIMAALSAAGLVEGTHGKGGGYKLLRRPEELTVGEILRLTEGDLAPVACLSCGAEPCKRTKECRTIGMWNEFNRITNDYFDGITLANLMQQ